MGRKAKNIHYLYKTTCNVTGRYYVGMHSTNNLNDGYMGSGKRLRYSIKKYGVSNHIKEILEFFETRELLIGAEINAITSDMITDKNCMNLMSGGTGGFSSEEHKRKFIESVNLKPANEKLKLLKSTDKDWCKNLSDSIKNSHKKINFSYNTFEGKTHSEETKELMSKVKKGQGIGETNSQYGTCWITKDDVNKKIKKEDLDNWVIEGWVKGRKIIKNG